MPLPTSDFRTPICREMRNLREQPLLGFDQYSPPGLLSAIEPINYNAKSSYNDRGSVDSSDTYASCQTHPCYSENDLTEEPDSNLYVNPMNGADKVRVKKSASGEIAHVTRDVSPSTESLKEINVPGRVGKVSANDGLPKHRKIRLQQVNFISYLTNI